MTATPYFIANMLVQWKNLPKVVSIPDVGGSHPFFSHVAHGTLGQVCTRGVFFSTAQQDPFLQVAMQAELKTMDQKITTLLQWVQAGKVTGPEGY